MKTHREKFVDYADAVARILELHREHGRRVVMRLAWHAHQYWQLVWHKRKD